VLFKLQEFLLMLALAALPVHQLVARLGHNLQAAAAGPEPEQRLALAVLVKSS
jgi:hypothetical protein